MLLCVNPGNWIHVNANATHVLELFIAHYAPEERMSSADDVAAAAYGVNSVQRRQPNEHYY